MLKLLQGNLLKMFMLVVMLLGVNAMWGQVNENFNTVTGTGGNDAEWSGSIASNALGTFGSWAASSAYKGDKCVKLGTGSNKGSITTPAIGLIGTATLTFRAGAWNGSTEQTDLVLTVTGTNTTLSTATVTMVKASFSSYTVTISNCTAASKVTFAGKNSSNSRFFLDDVVISQNSTSPTLSATPTSLTGFTYVVGTGPSDSQNFSISGSNFTTATGNLTVTGSTNYEVSLSQNSDFAASINVPYTGSAISNKTIYVRLKSGLATNSYNSETITISGGGVTTNATVTVNGSVTTPVPALTTNPASLSGFTYSLGTGPSASQQFSLSGANLTGTGNIAVSAPSNYQVSLNGIDFTSSVNVPYTSATLSAVTVYVRLKSGLNQGSYNGTTISITGGGASKTFALSGTVTQAVAVNDECTTAVTLTLNDAPKSGTRLNATQSISGTSSCGGSAEDDVWYKFTTSVAGEYKITFAPSGDIDGVIDLRSGACNNTINVACQDNTSAGNEVMLVTLPAASTYFVRVYDWYDASSTPSSNNFTIAVESPKPTLTANPSSLAFGNQALGTTSATKNFNLNGILLSNAPGNVSIASSNTSFQVSLNGSDWADNINLPYSASTLSSTTIYVRYIPAFFGNVIGLISVTGGDASTSISLSGTGTIAAPNATLATNLSVNGFTANWDAVPGASGYRLDVATTNDFNLGSTSTTTEGFAGGSAPSGWTFANLGTPYTSSGNFGTASPSLKFDNDVNKSTVTTATLTGTATQLSFWIKGQGISAESSFLVEGYNGTAWVTIEDITNITNSAVTKTYNATSTPSLPSNIKQFRFTYTKFSGNLSFDDVAITSTTGSSTFVQPYQDYVVNGTSQIVSELTANTTYYYRVRAVSTSANLTSDNSNIITVKTGQELIWDGTQWTGGVTPTSTDNGIIANVYTAPATGLKIGKLIVNSGVNVTIPANRTITIAGALVNNNPTADNFVVEDNGALVQTGTAANTGKITVLKNSNALYRLDYTMWSSPVNNQKLIDFSAGTTSNRFYEYKYDTNDGGATYKEAYWSVDPSNNFDAAKGYLIRMPNGIDKEYNEGNKSVVYNGIFKGEPHTGNYAVTLNTQNNRFTAVGNPYPSPISLEEFFVQNSQVLAEDTPIYLWRKRNSTTQNSSYATLTLASYVANGKSANDANGNATSGEDQRKYFEGGRSAIRLAPGQGFIVQAKPGAATNQLVFNNSMRKAAAATGGQGFLRSGQSPVSRLWLNLESTDGGFSQSAVAYMPETTNGIDYGFDGKQFIEAGTVALYTVVENKALAIQARSEFATSDVVTVGYNAHTAGTFTISIDHTDGLFAEGQNVYLKDNVMGITRNITEADYTFASEAGKFDDRFELVYTNAALGTDNPVITADSVIVYKNNETININVGTKRINAVTVFDIRGRKLYQQQNVNNTAAAVNGLTVQNQVLIVEIATEGGVVSKKIVF